MADPFAAASDLALLTGQTEGADLARAQMFLELASAEIRSYTGQVLSEVLGDVVVFEPTWSQTIYLPERPVTGVTQVLVKAVATTDYRLLDEAKIVRGSDPNVVTTLTWQYGATVTYNHGFAEMTEEYKTIKAVALDMVQRALFGPQGEVFGPERVEAVGWSAQVYLTEQDRMRLERFAGVRVG